MFKRIINLGWKNVWRNPTRSGVVIIAVILGTWAGIFISAFMNGMMQDYLQNQLNLSVGHLRITHPQFGDQYNPALAIDNFQELHETLQNEPYIQRIIAQSLTTGLAQSAINSYGTTIHGINAEPDKNHPVTEYLKKGRFLADDVRNPIVIGAALAERLELDIDSKMVLSFQDVEGNITAGAFRISGIFDSISSSYDKSNVFVRMADLNSLLEEQDLIHRVTLRVDDFTLANVYRDELNRQFPGLQVASWGEIAPELQYVFNTTDISLYILMTIIIIALVFSIVNTMLMAIMERTRELGMLMAVGMNRSRIFLMILSETFFLTMTGTPLGLLLSWGTISLLAKTGINLGAFAEGLNAYGMSTIIRPELELNYYLIITVMIASAAILSSLYPAWKALKLRPVEAIRKI